MLSFFSSIILAMAVAQLPPPIMAILKGEEEEVDGEDPSPALPVREGVVSFDCLLPNPNTA